MDGNRVTVQQACGKMIQVKHYRARQCSCLQMSVSFDSVALTGDQASQALPLVQAIWPGVDLAAWQRFVRFFSEEAGSEAPGVRGLRNPAGYLCGVIAYRRDWDLERGPILTVHMFTAM